MPEYIASGKDAYYESSVKVSANTDQEAFQLAKEHLPVVSKLERIEPDGTLSEVQGIAFDDINTKLAPVQEQHIARQEREAYYSGHKGKLIALVIMVVIASRLITCAGRVANMGTFSDKPQTQQSR